MISRICKFGVIPWLVEHFNGITIFASGVAGLSGVPLLFIAKTMVDAGFPGLGGFAGLRLVRNHMPTSPNNLFGAKV